MKRLFTQGTVLLAGLLVLTVSGVGVAYTISDVRANDPAIDNMLREEISGKYKDAEYKNVITPESYISQSEVRYSLKDNYVYLPANERSTAEVINNMLSEKSDAEYRNIITQEKYIEALKPQFEKEPLR